MGSPDTMRPLTRRSLRARRGHSLRTTIIAVALAVVGVGIMLYPSTASWFSELQQRDQLSGYAQEVSGTDPAARAAALAAARDYNAALVAGELYDPFTNVVEGPLDDAARDYLDQIVAQPGAIMTELRIPGIAAVLPVYQGTSDATLKRGIGHLYGSSLPVGGTGTHAVLTGHRGYPEATLFSNLDQLSPGDTFTITTLSETLTYRITGTEVVEPHETESLAVVPGEDLVTLITCTPTGINTHRLLVHAERTTGDESEDISTASDSMTFPWWAVGYGVVLVMGASILVLTYRSRRA